MIIFLATHGLKHILKITLQYTAVHMQAHKFIQVHIQVHIYRHMQMYPKQIPHSISIKQHTFPSACPPVETHGGCTSLRWCCSTSRGDISLGGQGSTTEGGQVEQDEARGSLFPSAAEGVCCSTSRSDTQTNTRTRKPRGSSFPSACMPGVPSPCR